MTVIVSATVPWQGPTAQWSFTLARRPETRTAETTVAEGATIFVESTPLVAGCAGIPAEDVVCAAPVRDGGRTGLSWASIADALVSAPIWTRVASAREGASS